MKPKKQRNWQQFFYFLPIIKKNSFAWSGLGHLYKKNLANIKKIHLSGPGRDTSIKKNYNYKNKKITAIKKIQKSKNKIIKIKNKVITCSHYFYL